MNTDFKVGEFIEDRYEIHKILRGGMGTVYVVFDIALDQVVAIKTFQVRYLLDEQMIKRFFSEAQNWILLERHPNIIQAKSTFVIEQQPFLVVEFVAGGDLRQKIWGQALDLRLTLDVALQFCAGAGHAYRKLGLIHRDIKPENLLLDNGGTLKITDFGLSRVGEEFHDRGKTMGTPHYMSPEQWTDAESVTKQSDIYSFGIVLYEMLTGQLPFQGNTWKEIRRAHEEFIPKNPKTINPRIPDELSEIVLKCLEKNPTLRFLYYEDLAEQLKQAYKQFTGQEYIGHDKTNEERLDSEAELLNNADSLFTIGRYAEALRYYDRLLELNPRSAKFWQRKGDTLARQGKYHEAELYFSKASEIEPSNLDAVKGRVKCLMSLGRRQDALSCCSPTLALNPNDRDLLKLKRDLLARTNNSSKDETSSSMFQSETISEKEQNQSETINYYRTDLNSTDSDRRTE